MTEMDERMYEAIVNYCFIFEFASIIIIFTRLEETRPQYILLSSTMATILFLLTNFRWYGPLFSRSHTEQDDFIRFYSIVISTVAPR